MSDMDNADSSPPPRRAGDFVTNHYPGPRLKAFRETPEEAAAADHRYRQWLSTMRVGIPQPTAAYTTKELEAQGMVGLYLKNDGATDLRNAAKALPLFEG